MHKIAEKEFALDDFSREHLIPDAMAGLTRVIDDLNYYRATHLDYKAKGDEELARLYWRQIIQLLPSSYNQRRTIMLNYEVLANIYKSRRNHKLDEWHTLCKWIETLPYSEIITGSRDVIKPATSEAAMDAASDVMMPAT